MIPGLFPLQYPYSLSAGWRDAEVPEKFALQFFARMAVDAVLPLPTL